MAFRFHPKVSSGAVAGAMTVVMVAWLNRRGVAVSAEEAAGYTVLFSLLAGILTGDDAAPVPVAAIPPAPVAPPPVSVPAPPVVAPPAPAPAAAALFLALGLGLATMLSACGTPVPGQPTVTTQTVAQDVALVDEALTPIVGALQPLVAQGKLQQADLDKVSQAVAALDGASQSVAAAPASASTVIVVEDAVNAIVRVATPFLSATPYGPILVAAEALLPAIETAVGLAVPSGRAVMPPDDARAFLRGVVLR